MTAGETCVRCGAHRAVGVLCAACATRLAPTSPMVPEQVEGLRTSGEASLVDAWGRPHAITPQSVLGRDGDTIRITRHGVSRSHLALERTDTGWTARDLGSRNGSSLDGVPLHDAPLPLADGALLGVADVTFVFVARPVHPVAVARAPTLTLALPRGGPEILLHENPMGDGGVLEIRPGPSVELPLQQFELLALLQAQRSADADADDTVRGFVTSAYLGAVISWSTPSPTPDHLKQLVRRTRQRLEGTGLTIESRRGTGYRLLNE